VPDVGDVRRELERAQERLAAALRGQLTTARAQASAVNQRLERNAPSHRVDMGRRQVDELAARATRAITGRIAPARARVAAAREQLAALNPDMTLRRGYAICRRADDGAVVTDAAQLTVGERIAVRFARGRAISEIEDLTTADTAPEEAHARG
jgi:exodeoxyribonuclease VII large subunit